MNHKHITIIAEIGVNHNGSLDTAKNLIEKASEAGVDIVKFQTFKTENLVTRKAEKARYQKSFERKDETQFEMLKRLELTDSDHQTLIKYCLNQGVQFLSTAFDHTSLSFLARLDMPFFKIPSGEITNLPYLRYISTFNKPIVMSTGMATMNEVEDAMNVILGAGINNSEITLLHCNTEYPTPFKDVNLQAMITMKNKFGVKVGYSDHTIGLDVPIAAAAMGASIIEKHFTLDRGMIGPDHAASIEPKELKKMVLSIRNIEKSIGSGLKKPSKSEKKNIMVSRKSIYAKSGINKGEYFTEENLIAKRPGKGISPMKWDNVIGVKAKKDFKIDDLIKI